MWLLYVKLQSHLCVIAIFSRHVLLFLSTWNFKLQKKHANTTKLTFTGELFVLHSDIPIVLTNMNNPQDSSALNIYADFSSPY